MSTWKFRHDRRPALRETCAFTEADIAKATALLFDRFFVSTREEPQTVEPFEDVPEEFTFGISQATQRASELIIAKHHADMPLAQLHALTKQCLMAGYAEFGIHGTAVYPTDTSFEQDFPNGASIAYQAALNNLPLASNKDLSWDQVLGFRADRDAVRKYRDLRLWLENGLNAASVQQATDLIAKRIEDYHWAVKKHGIKTITGALTNVLSAKSLTSIAAGAGISTLLSGPTAAALAGGLIVISKCSTWFVERRLEMETIKRENFADVALLCEAKKMSRKPI